MPNKRRLGRIAGVFAATFVVLAIAEAVLVGGLGGLKATAPSVERTSYTSSDLSTDQILAALGALATLPGGANSAQSTATPPSNDNGSAAGSQANQFTLPPGALADTFTAQGFGGNLFDSTPPSAAGAPNTLSVLPSGGFDNAASGAGPISPAPVDGGAALDQLPAEIGKPVPTDTAALNAMIAELKASRDKGLLASDIPAEMTANQRHAVKVTLSRGPAGAKLLSQPNVTLPSATEIDTSDFVSVTLNGGDAFDVMPVLPGDKPQDLSNRNTGQWDFWVTPTVGGTHDLQVIVLLYDALGYVPVAQFSQTVSVKVPFLSQVAAFLTGPSEFIQLFVAGALSILAAGSFERWWKSRELRRAHVPPSRNIDPSG